MNATLDRGYSAHYKDLKKEARKLKRQWIRDSFEPKDIVDKPQETQKRFLRAQ